jgi:ABC-type multidrug transport system, ATPase and permease components
MDERHIYEDYIQTYRVNRKNPLKILLSFFKGYQKRMFLTFIFLILKQSPVWVIPIVVANIINVASNPDSKSYQEIVILAGVALVFILQNVFTTYVQVKLFGKVIRDIELNLRSTLTIKLQELSMAFHKSIQSGKIMSKIMRDVENVQTLLYMSVGSLLNIVLDTTIAVVVIFMGSPMVLMFFAAVIPVAALTIYRFRKPIRTNNQEFRREMEETQAAIAEMVEMIPVTRAHGLEDKEIKRMQSRLKSVSHTGYRLDQINALFGATSWVVFQAFQILCLAFTGSMAYLGKISIGEVVLYQTYFSQIVNQVTNLINLYPILTRGVESIKSIGEIVDTDEIEANNAIVPLNELKGRVTFFNVVFKYEDGSDYILEDFNLDIPAGTSVAFVGGSGSGKSTLLNLLIGFYEPTEGRILIDGVNMSNIDKKEFRSQIAIVPQNTLLFSGSIRDNITYNTCNVTDEQILDVLADVGLLDMVSSLPEGIHTKLGEHGGSLSGGQRQRISIARALIRKPKLIIFDEATSALDTASEKLVQKATEHLMQQCTVVMVAHRLSTIKEADIICVMEGGKIVEKGSYEELMNKRGHFYDLKKLQD